MYNSNGDRIAKSEPALRNFYKWFGDSKVVDERGRPLVVYHGSYEKNITEFDKGTFGNNTGNMGMFGQGFYFTDETSIAEDYAGMEEDEEYRGKVYNVYLKIENPLIIDSTQEYGEYGNDNSDAALDALKKKKLLGKNEEWTDFYNKIWEDDKPAIFLSQYAKNNKFDGIFGYYTSKYFNDYGEKRAEFVAFEPNQIKSVDNRGTYSLDTGNIYFQARKLPNGWYDPELSAIVLTKNWNTMTLPHELHHYYLSKIIDVYNQAQAGTLQVNTQWLNDIQQFLAKLGIENPASATTQQIKIAQEQFASMTEAYLTGLGVQDNDSITYREFLNWIPEKYDSVMNIGYLDANGKIVNPLLDDDSVRFFNKWFVNIYKLTI